MKSKILLLSACFLLLFGLKTIAQNNSEKEIQDLKERTEKLEKTMSVLSKLKVSGYIQTQFQSGQRDASLKIGANNNTDKSFNRIGIRRGRLKFTYESGIFSGVFQFDLTDKSGVSFKDIYFNVKDPWVGTNAIRAGIFDRPFGDEINYSSSRRESPERSTIFQQLFPDERDLGVMLILNPAKNSSWNFLKLEAGLFAGNGIKMETDNRKDFIGHLTAKDKIGDNTNFGLGVSYYNGGVYQTTKKIHEIKDKKFVTDSTDTNLGEYAKREYLGFDAQLTHKSVIGTSNLRFEYLFGKQPGTLGSSKSPNSSSLVTNETYIRNFSGGYFIFVQSLGKLPVSVVLKYDWYDPNTKVSKNEIGQNGTSKTDLSQDTFGFGAFWDIKNALRLTAYYELNGYEKSDNLPAIKDLKRDVFTLRLQYKF